MAERPIICATTQPPTAGTRYCPACGSDWQGEAIPEESRHHYGGATHFRRAIWINYPSEGGRQGGNAIQCPDCGSRWEFP